MQAWPELVVGIDRRSGPGCHAATPQLFYLALKFFLAVLTCDTVSPEHQGLLN